jgi:hypothetical protein
MVSFNSPWRSRQAHALHVAIACALFLLAGTLFASSASAGPAAVFFGGIAFTDNATDVTRDFPQLSRLVDATGNARINAAIRQELSTHPSSIELKFDQLGSIRDANQSTALALTIDRETTSVERIGGTYKVRLEIAAQLLFFDFKEKQVLGGFPLVLDYIDIRSAPPTDEQLQAGFRHMVFDTNDPRSLVSEFVAALGKASVPKASSRYLRVAKVMLQPKALEYMAQAAPTLDEETLRTQVAQEFGKYLAANQGLAILPYRSNQALGASMAARFIEGEAYELKIPTADYDISLDVAGFKKIEQSHSNVSTLFLYGAFVDIDVREPLSGKRYFAQRVKQGASKDVPMTQASVDDWSASYETLLLLFNNFTHALGSSDGRWAKSALPEGRDARDQLSSLTELINTCR